MPGCPETRYHSAASTCLARLACQSTFPFPRKKYTFAATRPSSVLLEQLAVCVSQGEPVLLVGETGTGKTSAVQHLARATGT